MTVSSPSVRRNRRGRPKGAKADNAAGVAARERIVDSAMQLFGQRGFYGVSFADLSEVTGLAKATIAHHFKSKEKLYRSVLDTVAASMQSAFEPAFDPGLPARQAVTLLVRGVVGWGMDNPQQARLVAFEMLELPNRNRTPRHWSLAPTVEQTLDLLERARREKVIRDCPPTVVLEMLLGTATYHLMAEPLGPNFLDGKHKVAGRDEFRAKATALLEQLIVP